MYKRKKEKRKPKVSCGYDISLYIYTLSIRVLDEEENNIESLILEGYKTF